jgi:serine/threonine protein kinase
MRQTGMPIELIRKISIQILHGLNFFAKHKMIHCDIKP